MEQRTIKTKSLRLFDTLMDRSLPPRAGRETVEQIITAHWPPPQDVIKPHAVYVLECDPWPDEQEGDSELEELQNREEELLRRARRWVDYDSDEEDWVDKTFTSDRAFYVGSTDSPVERIVDHIWGKKAARFTTIFPPTEIFAVRWYATSDEVREKEEEVAQELRKPSASLDRDSLLGGPELSEELLSDMVDEDIYVYQA